MSAVSGARPQARGPETPVARLRCVHDSYPLDVLRRTTIVRELAHVAGRRNAAGRARGRGVRRGGLTGGQGPRELVPEPRTSGEEGSLPAMPQAIHAAAWMDPPDLPTLLPGRMTVSKRASLSEFRDNPAIRKETVVERHGQPWHPTGFGIRYTASQRCTGLCGDAPKCARGR